MLASDPLVPIWEAIRTTLDEMAKAFITRENPHGLRCYLYSHRILFPGTFRGERWEESITAGVAIGLRRKGISARTEQSYPQGSGRCDLVIDLGNGQLLWIECKTAYRMDLGRNLDGDKPTESLGKRSWREGVADIARKDIMKLSGLRPPHAHFVGVLLLGFDRDREEQRVETTELYSLLPAELCEDCWTAAHGRSNLDGMICPDRYAKRAEIRYRDRLWFWYRRVSK